VKKLVVLDSAVFPKDMSGPLERNRVVRVRPNVDRDGRRERLEIEEMDWEPYPAERGTDRRIDYTVRASS
jgi:hypothetical protein